MLCSDYAASCHLDVCRSCILRSFTVDMVGFTEAINIVGESTTCKPILQDLLVCCSGDDGISVSGKAQPLIRSCELRVRETGPSSFMWQRARATLGARCWPVAKLSPCTGLLSAQCLPDLNQPRLPC